MCASERSERALKFTNLLYISLCTMIFKMYNQNLWGPNCPLCPLLNPALPPQCVCKCVMPPLSHLFIFLTQVLSMMIYIIVRNSTQLCFSLSVIYCISMYHRFSKIQLVIVVYHLNIKYNYWNVVCIQLIGTGYL